MLSYVGFPIKVFILLKDPDWSNKIMSCAPVEKINQLHFSVIPILNIYQFQESVPMVNILLFQSMKYISTIGDILIQGCYLMLIDAFQTLLAIYAVQNMQWKVNRYIWISTIMYSEEQRHMFVMGENSRPLTIRICNHCTILSELINHTSCSRIRLWRHKLLLHPV